MGYKVGMQAKMTGVTKVLYMTDHMLLNDCLKDKMLTQYSCVIIDEAHERSIHTDLLLGLLKQCMKSRPELKVVITSATIDPDVFVRYFGGEKHCPVLHVSGRAFPVEVIWEIDEGYAPYPEDFENKALQKTIEIHSETLTDSGDILVFLTSAVGTTKCAEKFKQRFGDHDSVCLPLHGRLKPEDQQLVFEPTPRGKRKVIFATNIAETSVTIDGVKYVVDSGLVNEMRFDPKKNMSSLNTTPVSQSSANQRKGRAGRTSSGFCYRLYTENDYNQMDKTSTPEILRIHVAQAILKLLQLKVDPMGFDYVQSPSPAAMKSALEELISLGAADNNGITELGEWIARLPLEPKLGVMVKKGVDNGVTLEAMVVATACNQQVFFRAGSDEQKKMSDIMKLQFCHPGGDLLTLLTVYREWDKVKEREKGKWCNEKSINGKSMKTVRETVNEISTCLKKELNLKVKHEFLPVSKGDEIIQELIFSCMYTNLGYYLGHESAGYVVLRHQQHRVQLHPSSALLSLDLKPQWIVFNRVLQTSADYVTEVTPVSDDVLQKAHDEGQIDVDIDQLEMMRVAKVKSFCVGKHVFWKFNGPMHKNRKMIEQEIKDVCNNTPVVIEPNRSKGEISLYAVQMYAEVALDILNEHLRPLATKLLDERIEEACGEQCRTRAVLGVGGDVTDILYPEQTRVYNIQTKTRDLNEDEVRGALEDFGSIDELWQTTGKKNANSNFCGKVTFTREADGHHALESINADASSPFALVALSGPVRRNTNEDGYTMKLSWTRRNGKGFCYVTCSRPEDMAPILRLSTILISGRPVSIQMAKQNNNLYLKGLSPLAMEEDVVRSLADSIGLPQADKNRFKVVVPRENCIWRTNEIQRATADIENLLAQRTQQGTYRVYVKEYKAQTVTGVAFVTFNNARQCEDVAQSLADNICYLNGCPVKADVEYKTTVHVPMYLHGYLKSDIDAETERYRMNSRSTTVTTRCLKSGNFSIDIVSTSATTLAKAKVCIDRIVHGDTLGADELKGISALFSRQGIEEERNIEKSTNTIIRNDERQMVVTVLGLKDNRTKACEMIKTVVQRLNATADVDVCLKGDDNPLGLMKALVLKYGIKFEALKELTGLKKIALNFRHHEIALTGSNESTQKAVEIISAMRTELDNRANITRDTSLQECPVCLSPIEETDMIRLEFCGHAYCKECLTTQVQVAISNKDFPIVCAGEDCGKGFVKRDFKALFATNKIKPFDLTAASVASFVQQNNQAYKYCPTPNCLMIYKVSSTGERFACELCRAVTCTTCHIEFHEGLTCAIYSSAKKDDESVLKWIKEDPNNRKMCPKCDMGIEKIDGCDHMHCKCGVHICWKCLMHFNSSAECYGHLNAAHGSFV